MALRETKCNPFESNNSFLRRFWGWAADSALRHNHLKAVVVIFKTLDHSIVSSFSISPKCAKQASAHISISYILKAHLFHKNTFVWWVRITYPHSQKGNASRLEGNLNLPKYKQSVPDKESHVQERTKGRGKDGEKWDWVEFLTVVHIAKLCCWVPIDYYANYTVDFI